MKWMKWGVFAYFLLGGLFSGYLFCTLWMAQPKDEHQPVAASAAGDEGKKGENPPPSGTDKKAAPPATLTCADTPDGTPTITTIDPAVVAMGDNNSNVAIYGCNFKSNGEAAKTDTPKPDQAANTSAPTEATNAHPKLSPPVKTDTAHPTAPAGTDRKVYFNGVERGDTKLVGEHEFVAPLLSSDFAGPQTLAITIAAVDTSGKAIPGKTSAPWNLKVKSASDVTVTWHLVWPIGDSDVTISTRLILLVIFAGAFGGCITGLKSFVDYAGDCKLEPSWFPFYFAGPCLGAGVAFAFYAVIRGGLLAGTNVDEKTVNPFGMVAVAVLVGMFSDAAIRKLNEIFDTLFKPPKDTRSGTLLDFGICPDSLDNGTVNHAYGPVTFQAAGGTAPYHWTAENLPAGLQLTNAGVLQGIPTAAVGATTVTIHATDNTGKTGLRQISLTIFNQ